MSMQLRDYAKQERPYVINLDRLETILGWFSLALFAALTGYIFWLGLVEFTR